MPKIYNAAAYLRISNADETVGESESLTNQRKFIQDFVSKQEDIVLKSEKFDDGISGLVYTRPSFQEMIDEILEHKIDCVIVRDLSRLGRDYVMTAEYLRDIFPRYGVRFIAILDNIDTIDQVNLSEKLDVTMKTILNDSYSRDISRKTRSALRSKQQNGDYVGANPIYGYKRSDEDKSVLAIDEKPAEVVREIFALKKEGYSASRIATILNEKQISSPKIYRATKEIHVSSPRVTWSAQTIIRLLKDDTYMGHLTQGKQTTFNYKTNKVKQRPKEEWAIKYNAHEPIIQVKDFELVRKLMNLDTRTSPDKDNVYLFSGLLVCSCCGNRMVRKTVPYNGKKYFYYSCTTGKKNGCTVKSIKESELIQIVTECVQVHLRSVIDLEDLMKQNGFMETQEALQSNHRDILEELDGKKVEISSYKSTLYESLLQEVINLDEYNSYKKSYDMDLERLEKEIEMETLRFEASEYGKIPHWIESYKEFITESSCCGAASTVHYHRREYSVEFSTQSRF